MRRFFIALMIVLLPLRGWMADAMAIEMAGPALTTLTSSALAIQHSVGVAADVSHAHEPSAASHSHTGAERVAAASDCAGHARSGQSPSDNSHCKSCVVCQACNAVGLAVAPAIPAAFHATLEKSPRMLPSFASADRALSLKPPIS